MNTKTAKTLASRDPDLSGVTAALIRAGRRALEIAQQTGTPCYVWRNGRIENIAAAIGTEPNFVSKSTVVS